MRNGNEKTKKRRQQDDERQTFWAEYGSLKCPITYSKRYSSLSIGGWRHAATTDDKYAPVRVDDYLDAGLGLFVAVLKKCDQSGYLNRYETDGVRLMVRMITESEALSTAATAGVSKRYVLPQTVEESLRSIVLSPLWQKALHSYSKAATDKREQHVFTHLLNVRNCLMQESWTPEMCLEASKQTDLMEELKGLTKGLA